MTGPADGTVPEEGGTVTSGSGPGPRPSGMVGTLGLAAALVVLWLFLWGDLSFANVLSGAAVAAVLLMVFPRARSEGPVRHVVRPVALAHLALYFAYELVTSNLLLTREIMSRHSRIRTGVVACPLRTTSDGIVTVLANVLSLSPGTMMVEVLDGPPTLYVHVLLLHDVDDARRQVARLEELIIRAFGAADAVAGLEGRPRGAPGTSASGRGAES